MTKKRGLGKGLEVLFPAASQVLDNPEPALLEIDMSLIKPNPRQPRQNMADDKLQELADSIREHGVVQPVVVRRLDDGSYELIAGERRWRACRLLQLSKIPAIVRNYNDLEAAAVALIENIQRENLNPLEEAVAYRRLIDEYGLTQEDLSQRVGKSRPFISNMLRLLHLPDEVKEMINQGQLTAGHARAVLAAPDEKLQVKIARKVVTRGLSVRQTEELVKSLQEQTARLSRPEKPDTGAVLQVREIEESVQRFLNAPVKIRKEQNGGGKIIITFKDSDEMARLINRIIG
ncbi:ParB/RepB/Spo0J family partition protein [Desulfurispora thermophila]|uniref:ParB/RepB/Spo0J family partition protein n=1 Tax=Desulfurispora thermophila TaxID=265470 RepID=UPI0003790685|nr:ParB/RepB/Spo0J family partition protein [Desulfurispora thermophila]